MLRIGDAFYRLRLGLGAIYDDGEATAIAHEVIAHLTGKSRLERLSEGSTPLSAEAHSSFLEMETRLMAGEPLQYVVGYAFFLGRKFLVNNAVLIPRPETEELVQWILADGAGGSILDVGTGSGCIGISLKPGAPATTVDAIDMNSAALEIARQNAASFGAEVFFFEIDFLEKAQWERLRSYDIIVSNPPYIPLSERTTLHRNVRDWEPEAALFVPADDALIFYRAIAHFGLRHLLPGGRIYCEMHRDYAEATRTLFWEAGYKMVELRNDLSGAPRMIRVML